MSDEIIDIYIDGRMMMMMMMMMMMITLSRLFRANLSMRAPRDENWKNYFPQRNRSLGPRKNFGERAPPVDGRARCWQLVKDTIRDLRTRCKNKKIKK